MDDEKREMTLGDTKIVFGDDALYFFSSTDSGNIPVSDIVSAQSITETNVQKADRSVVGWVFLLIVSLITMGIFFGFGETTGGVIFLLLAFLSIIMMVKKLKRKGVVTKTYYLEIKTRGSMDKKIYGDEYLTIRAGSIISDILAEKAMKAVRKEKEITEN